MSDKANRGGTPKPVKIAETGEVFPSRSQAARSMGCSTAAVYKALKHGSPISGLHLMEAADEQCDGIEPDNAAGGSADLHSVLSQQLAEKDRQIAGLQDSVTALLDQLAAKDEEIRELTGGLSHLHEHFQRLDASLEYWQTAMRRCEEAADAKVSAVVKQYKQQPRSRFDGIKRFLTPSADAARGQEAGGGRSDCNGLR